MFGKTALPVREEIVAVAGYGGCGAGEDIFHGHAHAVDDGPVHQGRAAFQAEARLFRRLRQAIEANKRFFEDISMVPRQAYTMGIGTIMKAGKIVMVANGEKKAPIIKEAFFGPITPQVPASILQLHPDFTLVADEAALSQI